MSKAPDPPRRALGKGLSALLPSRPPVVREPAPVPVEPSAEHVHQLELNQIEPNPLQPRSVFETDRLEELAQSIRANGIIQPLVVRKQNGIYQLVAGERRLRAAGMAGLEKVPVVLQEIPDDRLLEITLIENIQREDLNPIEVAQAFDRLIRELQLNHEELGRRTGKDRSTITNMLRLLRLPSDVQNLVAERHLSMGHARAILGLPTPEQQRDVAAKASAQGLSVRQVERMVQHLTEPKKEPQEQPEVEPDPNVRAAIEELERVLGTRVRIVEKSNQRGRIEIEYFSAEELDRIYQQIVGEETTVGEY